ncbi:MAG: hypothetical protein RLY86_3235 [Pseudomonadota bacterium]
MDGWTEDGSMASVGALGAATGTVGGTGSPSLLLDAVVALSSAVRGEAAGILGTWQPRIGRRRFRLAAPNLARYLALRHHDLRDLQMALMPHGLSSLGRCEGRVEETLSAVTVALAALAGRPVPPGFRPPDARRYFRGDRLLAGATAELFGAVRDPAGRRVRILVTLPSEAATEPELLMRLVGAGMDAVRINCAHDGPDAWAAMIRNLRTAEARFDRRVRILMDLAGPKVRTGSVLHPEGEGRLYAGDRFQLVEPGDFPRQDGLPVQVVCAIPGILARVHAGDRVHLDDGKVATVVEGTGPGTAVLHILRAPAKGWKPKAEKGLNFPNTDLGLPALTEDDRAVLPVVAAEADMIGYSFVQSADDVQELQAALARLRPADWHRLGLVAKIETPKAVRNLPGIIVAASGRQPFGIMIARGDLAVELGFERTAEMQEEILWLAEAAHVPVIWATQVLESLVKDGLPTRGEMTDAAMSARAECVMLNKGPNVVAAVTALDGLLSRMAAHQVKKTPRLRALASW